MATWKTSTAKRFLLLSNGQRLERPLTPTDGIKISEFETYGAQVGGRAGDSPDATPVRTRTTLTLLRDPTAVNRGELAWRIGMLFGAANFVLLALALSSVNPRVGRSGNLIFLRCSPSSFTTTCSTWGRTGSARANTAMGGFMLALHGGALVFGLLWLAKRHFNWGFPSRRCRPATTRQRVKTIRRLIYVEVVKAVAFVALGFLSLFFFFDFVDELQSIGRPEALGYGAARR